MIEFAKDIWESLSKEGQEVTGCFLGIKLIPWTCRERRDD